MSSSKLTLCCNRSTLTPLRPATSTGSSSSGGRMWGRARRRLQQRWSSPLHLQPTLKHTRYDRIPSEPQLSATACTSKGRTFCLHSVIDDRCTVLLYTITFSSAASSDGLESSGRQLLHTVACQGTAVLVVSRGRDVPQL